MDTFLYNSSLDIISVSPGVGVVTKGRPSRGSSIGQSDYVILVDADGSMPFQTIMDNLHILDEYDALIFSR